MKILIADDHRLIVEDLKSMIAEIMPEAEITGSSEPSEILPLCKKNGFHVIFLDIELDDLNGIKLAEKILNEFPRTNIIYITGYEKYALESYRTHASGFLLKPIDPCMLEDTLNNLRFPVSSITENMLVSQNLSGAVIGMNIKKCREERGMSRNDFAEELGCVLSTVGRWENGTRLPDVAMLMRIANLLGVTLSDLLE